MPLDEAEVKRHVEGLRTELEWGAACGGILQMHCEKLMELCGVEPLNPARRMSSISEQHSV